ncbi:MAG: aldo/keto reductase family protein [Alphaproteobacteria bacterium]|nr:aldo/keto reductase family protein [Alphaproteobacteria bacterium]MBL7098352.1 aldo/keto reductase family protein [Alphaproteobacteria bacterium]
MKLRKLGASDLHVSEISLGTWLTYGVGVEKDTAIKCVHHAFEVGINFIDTANVYGRGSSETVLGEALAGRRRDSYVLATKVFGDMGGGNQGLSRVQIEKQLEDSLKRLRTDYFDLYQCHRYDTNTPLEETMEALTRAVKSGKVRYLGFSEWSPDQIQASIDMKGVEHFVSSQPQYSLLWRRPEQKVIPLCAKNGISQIVWSPLAQGVLTGKYDPNKPAPAGTRAASDNMGGAIKGWMEKSWLEGVQRMKPLAQEAGLTMAQFALAWVLREPNIASAIVGASRPDQLDDNVKASGAKVDPALFAKAEKIAEESRPPRTA